MKSYSKAIRIILIAWLVSITLFSGEYGAVKVLAQSLSTPSLRITQIDINAYPLIRVSLFGENLNESQQAASFSIEEDRVQQDLLSSQQMEVGVQSAIVIDASRNILSQGNTGDPRLFELSRAVGRLIQLELLSAQTDWLAAFGTGVEIDTHDTIAEWQQDHQGVVNSLIQWRPENRPVIGSLFSTVNAAFDKFESTPAPTNVRRSMVVFSDGADIVSNIETDDIVRMAERLDIRIHTVLLGPPARDSRRNLGRLAELTGGLFVELNAVEDLDPIWTAIAAERQQHVLTYRMDQAQPQELRVIFTVPDGREVTDSSQFPVVGARPVEIQIASPTTEHSFVREADSPKSPLETLQPADLPIQVEFLWPDNHPRQFTRVEYTLGTDTRVVDAEPYNRFDFPVANLGAGNHTIRVTAIDELGLSSSSAPLSIPFQLIYPSEAEPQSGEEQPLAENALLVEAPQSSGLRIGNYTLPPFLYIGSFAIPVNLQTLGMFVLPLLLLICIAMMLANRKSPENPYFISEPMLSAEPYADLKRFDPNIVTVPAVSAFEMDEISTEPVRMLEFDVVAHIVLHGGATHLPERFPLQEGQQVRIGRHSSYSDIILEDTRVSRQHATLEWDKDAYTIRDEGSAGGTYVNKRRLQVGDLHKLEDGDIINFNEVAYRYEQVVDNLLTSLESTMPTLDALEATLRPNANRFLNAGEN